MAIEQIRTLGDLAVFVEKQIPPPSPPARFLRLPAMPAADVPNGALFHDEADGKLKWKDPAGVVQALY